mgnify:CR=1 FL=1
MKNIVIIGSELEGQTLATRIALNKCNIPIVVESEFTGLKELKPYLITKIPEMPELWTDPSLPKFNDKKFSQTCKKNREKRRRKKRK